MKIQVLLATMFFENEAPDFLDKMNIQTDLVIGNQCDKDEDCSFLHQGHQVTILSRAQRGVGKNRNLCLDHSDADVVLFADNDVNYVDGYSEIIENYYLKNPDADVVIFNFKEKRGNESVHDTNMLNKRAKLKDITKFGGYAISAKRQSLLDQDMRFSLSFGGGAKYGCGEDTLFLLECYRKGLQIHLCSHTLGCVAHRESTWFHGVNEKYIFDKGALLCAMCPKTYFGVIFYHAFKHRKLYATVGSFRKTLRLMYQGAKDYQKQ